MPTLKSLKVATHQKFESCQVGISASCGDLPFAIRGAVSPTGSSSHHLRSALIELKVASYSSSSKRPISVYIGTHSILRQALLVHPRGSEEETGFLSTNPLFCVVGDVISHASNPHLQHHSNRRPTQLAVESGARFMPSPPHGADHPVYVDSVFFLIFHTSIHTTNTSWPQR
ncbi:unnamed protein product [Protopolystoma xenopodis]|uniref:Uncharacterized protein n=1 Tax=Protopolystoma xenopodis TaxID=117903 RepID=A0A448XR95_9PLAT|nr:unnamed protein product [Protopolystoma xenopodis]